MSFKFSEPINSRNNSVKKIQHLNKTKETNQMKLSKFCNRFYRQIIESLALKSYNIVRTYSYECSVIRVRNTLRIVEGSC